MPRKLLYLILLISCMNVFARKPNSLEFIYTYSTDISIERVTTTKKATRVDFVWIGDKGDGISIPSDCWLIGADKSLHALKSINGIKPGVIKTSSKDGYRKKFSMTFEPLAETDTVFDIVSRHDFLKFFCFFGVHASSITPQIRKPEAIHLLEMSADYGVGTTRIMGRIDNYTGKGEKASMYYLSADSLHDNNAGTHAEIDSTGFFCMDISIATPMFSYLRFGVNHFPIFLYPNDTITCGISDLGRHSQRMTCKSSKGNDMHERFLEADPNGPWYEWIISNKSEDASFYQDFFENAEDEVASFYGYLSGKYQLSDEEYHLLYQNSRERLRLVKLIVRHRFPDAFKDLQILDPEPDPCRNACHNYHDFETFRQINPTY